MKDYRTIEISVKSVFTGDRSAEQAFIDLIRKKSAINPKGILALTPGRAYTGHVVFPGVHAPERGIS